MRIKRENRTLRKELIDLIQKNTTLHEQKVRLEEERKILTHEKETKEKLECLKQARIDAASKLCESDIQDKTDVHNQIVNIFKTT